MKDLKLRRVEKAEWKIEPKVDGEGFSKCVELDGFKYVFVDYLGKVFDLRPKENIPSFNNFSKKSEKELYTLVITALKKQIESLKSSGGYDRTEDVLEDLETELTETNQEYIKKYS